MLHNFMTLIFFRRFLILARGLFLIMRVLVPRAGTRDKKLDLIIIKNKYNYGKDYWN